MVRCYLIDFSGEPVIPSLGRCSQEEDARGAFRDLPEGVVSDEYNHIAVQEVVHWQLAKRRRGTAQTKLISEVSATKRKPWRQKGTGRARHGNLVAPQFRGGAVVFGPRHRDFSYSINKKLRRKALHSAITLKFAAGMFALAKGAPVSEVSTRSLVRKLTSHVGFSEKMSVLYCLGECSAALKLSGRNVPNLNLINVEGLNVLDIMKSDLLVVHESVLDDLLSRLV